MTVATGLRPRIIARDVLAVRDATPHDNAALIQLTAACPMNGDIALCMDRAPDFFALNRLEGDNWRVGVVPDHDGALVGCVAIARRRVFVNGVAREVAYVGDLKVHPRARGSGAADALTRYAVETATALCGPDAWAICTVLAGNSSMERRIGGPRGTPVLSRVGTLSVQGIPLLWERNERVSGLHVRAATDNDLDAIVEFRRARAPARQFGPDDDVSGFSSWISQAPGLAVSDYLVVTDSSTAGRLRGALGIWDQRAFKQMRVVSYSTRLRWVRYAVNTVAPIVGAASLPEAGERLPSLAAVHACADDAAALRALLLEAYRRHRGRYALITLGLDERDPLMAATRGLLAQPTRVHAYVTNARAPVDVRELDGRPLQFETALV